MGLLGNRDEKKMERKRADLQREYELMYLKGKRDKALAALEELFELGSDFADYTFVRTYDLGYLFCEIDHYHPLHKKKKYNDTTLKEKNAVGKSVEKVRYYLQKILDRYGEKAKLPHTQLSVNDNYQIGCLKTKIAYTYYYRKAKLERINTGESMITPSGRRVACTYNAKYEYHLSEPVGNEHAKYMEWIKEAALLNQNHDALMRLALAYSMEYEVFGLERDVDAASALAVRALQNYVKNNTRSLSELRATDAYRTLFHKYDILDLLKELGKENQLADTVHKTAMKAEEKARLQHKKGAIELEHTRVSMIEDVADVTWRSAKTGEKIENIDAELKKMEEAIAQIEKRLASM